MFCCAMTCPSFLFSKILIHSHTCTHTHTLTLTHTHLAASNVVLFGPPSLWKTFSGKRCLHKALPWDYLFKKKSFNDYNIYNRQGLKYSPALVVRLVSCTQGVSWHSASLGTGWPRRTHTSSAVPYNHVSYSTQIISHFRLFPSTRIRQILIFLKTCPRREIPESYLRAPWRDTESNQF